MLRVISKFLLSFLKSDWDLDDYPVRLRHFAMGPAERPGRLQPVAWSAQVINWPAMQGHGETAEKAMADLRERFAVRKQMGLRFPRPGRGLPLEFAPVHRIGEHPDLARDFLSRILDLDYDQCFISDRSTLWDFHGEDSNDHLNERVLLTYGVDISDIEDGNLADIFIRLVSHGVSAEER